MEEKKMRLPLEGVKVVEMGTVVAAPTTARVLASYGADVINRIIESTRPGGKKKLQDAIGIPRENLCTYCCIYFTNTADHQHDTVAAVFTYMEIQTDHIFRCYDFYFLFQICDFFRHRADDADDLHSHSLPLLYNSCIINLIFPKHIVKK